MKKVLKIVISLALLLAMTAMVTACGRDDNGAATTADDDSGLSIFLISHSPPPDSTLDDGSFNQGAADGIRNFLTNNPDSTWDFMQPHAGTDEARLDIFADAIAAGADVLVLPGFHFQDVVYDAQHLFPDTYFIVLDTGPRRGGPGGEPGQAAPNLAGILYAEHESGFLAGYATVREGFTELGFMGGLPVPAVVRFGHGFLQGAEHAAQQMGLAPGTITVNYMYMGGFGADPAHTATANGWYAGGTEVIFVAAGAVGFSVMEAAAAGAGRWVIGVDVDQGENPTVITSAMKALDNSVYTMLSEIRDGRFRGGAVHRFTAADDGVALPMHNSRFTTFTQAQYNAIFQQLATGSIRVSDLSSHDDLPTIIAGLSAVVVVEL
ncbi:MAG: BMP family ABC transporter substrate-binding protein [Defluviitaleaceae bacterium]|nr:BMP family ABC transporter substrate-binding protein [Defluviitaleaceae bacterium]MCL2239836.1 BMP family ABC transporter substrate-binding protein [Defluviitaleaceae bacterium]